MKGGPPIAYREQRREEFLFGGRKGGAHTHRHKLPLLLGIVLDDIPPDHAAVAQIDVSVAQHLPTPDITFA